MHGSVSYPLAPIGFIRSCFREKFGIPRQPGLVPDSRAVLKLADTAVFRDALRGIEGFSHLWIVTVFHEHLENGESHWNPLVRPPRLGGAVKMGVFATRSPHRPNPIGISAVELERADVEAKGGPELHLKGIDFLDGTPVLDIKPYIAYTDSIPQASQGWAGPCDETRPKTEVRFEAGIEETARRLEDEGYSGLTKLIRQLIAEDPRPAFQARRENKSSTEIYACRLYDFDVRWRTLDHVAMDNVATVIEIEDLRGRPTS